MVNICDAQPMENINGTELSEFEELYLINQESSSHGIYH